MIVMWMAAALAQAPAGYTFVKQHGDCAIHMRPETHPEGPAMRADCTWADVDPVHMATLMGDYGAYDKYIWPIDRSEIRRTETNRTLVYQYQEIWGISDREALLWISKEEPGNGEVIFRWHAATEEPLPEQPGVIRTPKNNGFWSIKPDGKGGSVVAHQVAIDAGGSIPKWIIKMVRTRGFTRVMDEMRTIAVK